VERFCVFITEEVSDSQFLLASRGRMTQASRGFGTGNQEGTLRVLLGGLFWQLRTRVTVLHPSTGWRRGGHVPERCPARGWRWEGCVGAWQREAFAIERADGEGRKGRGTNGEDSDP